jgi:hypothetical protein
MSLMFLWKLTLTIDGSVDALGFKLVIAEYVRIGSETWQLCLKS